MIIRSIREALAGREVRVIGPDATLRDAQATLDAADIGALAVLEGDTLIGILGEGEVIRNALARGWTADAMPVWRIRTPDPIEVGPEACLSDALQTLSEGEFRPFAAEKGRRRIGILSMRDSPTDYWRMVERFVAYVQGDPRAA